MTIGGVSHRSSRHVSSRRSGLSPSSFSGEPNRYNQDNLVPHQHFHRASRHSQNQRNALALSHADSTILLINELFYIYSPNFFLSSFFFSKKKKNSS